MSASRSRKRRARHQSLPTLDLDTYRDRVDDLQYAVGGGGLVVFTVPADKPRRWWRFWRRRERSVMLLFGAELALEQLEQWAKQLSRPNCMGITASHPHPMRVVFHDPDVRRALHREVMSCLIGFLGVQQLPLRLKDIGEQAASVISSM